MTSPFHMEKLKRINKELAEKYGKEIDGSPKFRLSFVDSQHPEMEWRRGHFMEFSGPIFLRETRGVKYVPKYPLPAQQDRFVLERLWVGIMPPELVGLANRSYEPLYFFPREKDSSGKEGRAICPTMKALEFIIHPLLYGRRRTKSDFEAEEAKAEAEEIQHFLDIQEEGPSYLQMLSSFGEAVFAPRKVFTGND